ncbi:hypothetical protein [Burkholderia sp. PU8-34]
MPTSTAPRLPPPAKTKAVDGAGLGGTLASVRMDAAPGAGTVTHDDGPGRRHQVLMKTLPGGPGGWPSGQRDGRRDPAGGAAGKIATFECRFRATRR